MLSMGRLAFGLGRASLGQCELNCMAFCMNAEWRYSPLKILEIRVSE